MLGLFNVMHSIITEDWMCPCDRQGFSCALEQFCPSYHHQWLKTHWQREQNPALPFLHLNHWPTKQHSMWLNKLNNYRILMPAFLTAEAVPPDPSNSRPRSESRLANSTRPRLSETLSRARHVNTHKHTGISFHL